jgi:hypothetical protein
MSKFAELQKKLEETTNRARVAVAESVPAPVTPVVDEAPRPKSKAALMVEASRAGKVHVGGYFDPQVKKSLRMIQLQTDQDLQTLILRALNDLFRAYNVPVVDQE